MTGILRNKVAVITGGSRGLGLAIAQTFAREGAKIVIASRSQRSVDSAVEMLRATGAQAAVLVHLADVDAGRRHHHMIMKRRCWSRTRLTASSASAREMRASVTT